MQSVQPLKVKEYTTILYILYLSENALRILKKYIFIGYRSICLLNIAVLV